ncbi:hypothetical protein [Nocardioides sp. LS1]|uniref:hypothetical protein n=1 Tax=Nocardioides sp. LS1 TaxID=1027620 RepID=UPI000F61F13D|nr:hypothetical protein [Nocardioides sp. LS1]GCD91018.1 hypothetical protein NLS1_30240 [Nocardioides sp. LS1]
MRRILATVAVLLALPVLVSCGGGDSSSGDVPTKTIEVTINGDSVTPNGDRIVIDHGQTVELVVKADKPGEIHVHSTPEQEFQYGAGTTTLTVKNLDKPGIVDIESHSLEKTIVQLEIR